MVQPQTETKQTKTVTANKKPTNGANKTSEPEAQISWDKSFDDDGILFDSGEERSYFVLDLKNVLKGRLIGRNSYTDIDTRTSEERLVLYYVFHTSAPCKVVSKDEKEAFILPAGNIVHLNERHRLKEVLDEKLDRTPFVWEFQIQPVKEVKIGGGRTVWNFRIAGKPTKIQHGQAQAALNAGDDIPF